MSKQSDILDAAQNLFVQYGLKRVTTDEVARTACVSKATVYKYYSNKYEIFNEVVRIETDKILLSIMNAVENKNSVESKLKAFLITKTKTIYDLIKLYKVTEETWGDHWPYISEYHATFMEHEKQIVKDILEYGNETGELALENPVLSAHVLVISLKAFEYPWAVEGLEVSLTELVNHMIAMFMDGVKKEHSTTADIIS